MLNLGNSLLHACCVFFYVAFRLNAANVTYEPWSNQYFDISSVQNVQTRSAIECCAMCEFDETCSTVNYNRENSECELLLQRPQLRVDFVTRLNWTSYMKPGCRVEDWVQFKLSYYLLVEEEMDWHHADGYCMTLGAELVDIHSAEEWTFVRNYYAPKYLGAIWIGLNDNAEEGSYRWSSRRPTTYTNYHPVCPTGGRDYNCVGVDGNNGLWCDGRCPTSYAFVCKKSTI